MDIATLMRIARHLEIVALLNNHSSMSSDVVAHKLRLDQDVVGMSIEDLADAGVLQFNDDSRWSLVASFVDAAVHAAARDALLRLDVD